jgi:hypothetical protein
MLEASVGSLTWPTPREHITIFVGRRDRRGLFFRVTADAGNSSAKASKPTARTLIGGSFQSVGAE